jgi:signal transduction histidine kinase
MSELYRFAEIGKLTSGILHDLVTPLSSMSLNLEQLKNPEQSKLISRAKQSAERMESFIQEARKQIRNQKDRHLFSVNRELTSSIGSLHDIVETRRLKIHFKKTHDFYLYGSPTRFHQVIINILKNALESYEGSSDEAVTVTSHGSKENLVIIIQDWGHGISPLHINHIFEPLFSTKSESGTGLGLVICRTIIEDEFAGTVSVESKEGIGSTFTLNFPHRDQKSKN